ncbi:MAG TPA: ATP-binding protein [Gemmatimonadaceae bacterium]|nr:ATP-binding protein [Gemmatimonadaceae bacterium]
MTTGLRSVRFRLTFWYALVLAFTLIVCAAGAWIVVQRVLQQRAEQFLADARDAFLVELHAEEAEMPTLVAAIGKAMQDIRMADVEFMVLDSASRPVAASGDVPNRAHQATSVRLSADTLAAFVSFVDDSLSTTVVLPGANGGNLIAIRPAVLGSARYRIAAVQSRRWLHNTMRSLFVAWLAVLPLVLAVSTAGGYLMARRALAPVADMSRRARAISAANLDQRLAVVNAKDELGELATMINALLARVEQAFAQQRRLVADASHELRTPVAVIRAEADVALARQERPAREYRDALEIVSQAGERLSGIVNDLFLLARSDGGPVPLSVEALYLDELIIDTARVMRTLADRRTVRIDVPPLAESPLTGDPELLGRLLLNLVDNAIKHSPPGGAVAIRLGATPQAYTVSVTDEGPGVPLDAQDRIFERFYRAAPSTANAAETGPRGSLNNGAGLGLAIARYIAEAHGGTLELARSSASGSEFRLTLPRQSRGVAGAPPD